MIAVIGHGRSPEGKGWGTDIDLCEVVIRMWDNDWQNPVDYGTDYDYGLFVLTPKGLSIFNKYNTKQPSMGWLAYFGKLVKGPVPEGTHFLNNPLWNTMAQELGGAGLSGKLTLTRGTAAACWAIEEVAQPGETVVLVGFDNVCLGVNQPIKDSFCPEYWEQYSRRFAPEVEKVYPIGGTKTATHDMVVERPLLELLARQRGVYVRTAQEVWK